MSVEFTDDALDEGQARHGAWLRCGRTMRQLLRPVLEPPGYRRSSIWETITSWSQEGRSFGWRKTEPQSRLFERTDEPGPVRQHHRLDAVPQPKL